VSRPYSPIEHLALTVFLDADLRDHWFAMLAYSTYIDDSASQGIIGTGVAAGYVAKIDQWVKFKEEWNSILDDPYFGLPPDTVFHMKEFAPSTGQFACLKGKTKERDELMKRLSSIIRARVRIGVSCSVESGDYAEVDKQFMLTECFGNAFAFCGRYSVGRVCQWALKNDIPTNHIEYVVEQGTRGFHELSQTMVRDGFPAPIPKPKGRGCAPLQAADLWAWEMNKACREAFAGALKELRKSLDSLSDLAHEGGGLYESRERLIEFCVQNNVPPRTKFSDV
jgi:hypothetical protein